MAISHQAFVSCNVPSILGSPPQVHVFNHYVSNPHNETCSFTHGIRNASGNFEPIMCGAEQPLEDVAFYKIWNTTHQAFFFFEVPMYHYFRFNYYCTLISCTFGIVKFLELGPTRCLAEKGWLSAVGYTLAWVSVFHSLIGKANGLGTDGVILNTVLTNLGYCNVSSSKTI